MSGNHWERPPPTLPSLLCCGLACCSVLSFMGGFHDNVGENKILSTCPQVRGHRAPGGSRILAHAHPISTVRAGPTHCGVGGCGVFIHGGLRPGAGRHEDMASGNDTVHCGFSHL